MIEKVLQGLDQNKSERGEICNDMLRQKISGKISYKDLYQFCIALIKDDYEKNKAGMTSVQDKVSRSEEVYRDVKKNFFELQKNKKLAPAEKDEMIAGVNKKLEEATKELSYWKSQQAGYEFWKNLIENPLDKKLNL